MDRLGGSHSTVPLISLHAFVTASRDILVEPAARGNSTRGDLRHAAHSSSSGEQFGKPFTANQVTEDQQVM
jgi:hypothetical protein